MDAAQAPRCAMLARRRDAGYGWCGTVHQAGAGAKAEAERKGQRVAGFVAIVGGSVEAWHLAQALPGARVFLPATERVARLWPAGGGTVVTQGMPGPEALSGAVALIEAAHPCDARSANRAAASARAAGLPHLQLVRPEWRAGPRDRWFALRDVRQARALPRATRVLVTLGRAELTALRGWQAHALVRRIGPARGGGFPLPRGRFLSAPGPFSVADEIAMMRRERVDWLLLRNAGGSGGWPKLAAARALGLPVAMVARPRRPDGARVATVEEALAWLHRQNS